MASIPTFPTKPGFNYPITPTRSKTVVIPNGRAGIVQTLAQMRAYADEYKVTPLVRETATRLVKTLPQKDYFNEIRALFNYVRDSIRYTRDIYGVETVQTPQYTLEHRVGDCDDKATLLASLLESIGFETRFHAMGRKVGGICHVIVEVRNPVTGLWIPLETTQNVEMGWMPPDVYQHIYYYADGKHEQLNGFFSNVVNKIKGVGKKTVDVTRGQLETAARSTKQLSKGDVRGALSTSWKGAKNVASGVNELRKDIHKAAMPPFVLNAEGRLTDATVKALGTKTGSIVLSILSVIPVTAPFALAAQGGMVVAQIEAARKALSQMDSAQRKAASEALATARYVYDPAIQQIRERQPTGDEGLQEFKYIDGKLIQLSADDMANVNAELTPAQRKKLIDNTVAAVAERYPDYAAGLKKALERAETANNGKPVALGELGFGWGEAFGQVATQVAGQYASGKIAANFAHQQMKDQLKVMNSQLAKQPQTPPVQGQRAAISQAINDLSSFTSQYGGAIMLAGGALVLFLLWQSRHGKRR